MSRLSLLWKIWLSTSVALTTMFAAAGWLLQRHAIETTTTSLEEEVRTSVHAYESVWRAREEMLASAAAILRNLPDVRAAFGTRDQATIRDKASELWDTLSDRLKEAAFFLVTTPEGSVITRLGADSGESLPKSMGLINDVRSQFPTQVSGFFVDQGRLFQLVLTPVYVDSARGQDLISVLVAGYPVNDAAAQRLRLSTGGSEFVFFSGETVFASSLPASKALPLARHASGAGLASDGTSEYSPFLRILTGLDGKPIGSLGIFRSFEASRGRLAQLRRDVVYMWITAILFGLALTYLLARRIVRPVGELDRAASEIARQNYSYRVKVESGDELGRLGATFNQMCDSLQSARRELIRQERISTIGRLASSIVHDLRNPLAAIYGGAEMMVDTDLSQPQIKRLASNIYHASRRIQAMLQDLLNVSRGRAAQAEMCRLFEVVEAAIDAHFASAAAQNVKLIVDVDDAIELPLERARMERVFLNLVGNALEVMPTGGEIRIHASRLENVVLIEVTDTGPGISKEIREQLFQPFVTFGKKNGLGLGLALSRQTVLDHGGDMWADQPVGGGARFSLRLPLSAVREEVV
jgi:signal transduction histidine kinase